LSPKNSFETIISLKTGKEISDHIMEKNKADEFEKNL